MNNLFIDRYSVPSQSMITSPQNNNICGIQQHQENSRKNNFNSHVNTTTNSSLVREEKHYFDKPTTPTLSRGWSVNHLRSKVAPSTHQQHDESKSVRSIIQEGGSLIQGIRSKLQTLEKNKHDLQLKISNFENKMQALEDKRYL